MDNLRFKNARRHKMQRQEYTKLISHSRDGKVLTSDSSGNATWQTTSMSSVSSPVPTGLYGWCNYTMTSKGSRCDSALSPTFCSIGSFTFCDCPSGYKVVYTGAGGSTGSFAASCYKIK